MLPSRVHSWTFCPCPKPAFYILFGLLVNALQSVAYHRCPVSHAVNHAHLLSIYLYIELILTVSLLTCRTSVCCDVLFNRFFLYILLQLGTIVQYFVHWTDYVFILVSEQLAFSIRSLWRPSPRWIQELSVVSVVRDKDGRPPKRTLWQCTASVYIAGVYCWEISLR